MHNNSVYSGEQFSRISGDKTVYERIECEKCTFTHCSFVDCTFKECKFIDCTFTECTLSALKPYQTVLHEVSFVHSKTIGVDWTKARSIRSLVFDHSILDYSNFSYVKHQKLMVKECTVHEVDFTEADLKESSFEGSDLLRSLFHHTNLKHCNFKRAYNYIIDVTDNKVIKAQFSLPEAVSLLKPLGVEVE